MINPRQTWLAKRDQMTLLEISLIFSGKFLVPFALGAFLAAALRGWGWPLLLLAVLLDLQAKWRWLGKFPSGSPKTVWEGNRSALNFGTLCQMTTAKSLAGLSLGVILAPWILPFAWWIFGLGMGIGLYNAFWFYRK